MRFALAATALAWQTLPISSLLDDTKKQESARNVWAEERPKVLRNSPAGRKTPRSRLPEFKASKTPKGRLAKKRSRVLTNNRQEAKESRDAVECDPNTPDQGILACGNDKYCLETSASSSGGICASRRLQAPSCSADTPCPGGAFCALDFGTEGSCEICPCGNPVDNCYELNLYGRDDSVVCAGVCEPVPEGGICQGIDSGYGDYGYEGYYYCDYSGYNEALGLGTVTCYGTICEDNCCLAYELSYTILEDGNYSYTISFNVTQPYSQSGSVYFSTESGCELSFNGFVCTSCNVTGYTDPCFDYDCSNVIGGRAGFMCDYFDFVPAVDICLGYGGGGNGCEVCGPGNTILYPETTVVVPNVGVGEISCAFLDQYATIYGSTGDFLCTTLSEVAVPCCVRQQGSPGSPGGCNICVEGELLYPDATVSLPDTGDYKCHVLHSAGLHGYFGPDGCAGFEALAGPPCCGPGGS